MSEEDLRESTIKATLLKYADIVEMWGDADNREKEAKQTILDARAAKKAANSKYSECLAVARLFEFDLVEQWERFTKRRDGSASSPPSAMPSEAEGLPKTIKEIVLETAQSQFPNPVRASTLQLQLATLGIETHQKTVGMTLYRLLKAGLLRRDGRDWFFVPPEQRGEGRPFASADLLEQEVMGGGRDAEA